MRSDMPATER